MSFNDLVAYLHNQCVQLNVFLTICASCDALLIISTHKHAAAFVIYRYKASVKTTNDSSKKENMQIIDCRL